MPLYSPPVANHRTAPTPADSVPTASHEDPPDLYCLGGDAPTREQTEAALRVLPDDDCA